MDFIFYFPKTQSGHNGIWTIIDQFSKHAHFIPVKKTVKPQHLARLYVTPIFRLHGMPEMIVSVRDPRFTSLFWKAIWENIGTRLQFSPSFHPQTDGQSEIANSVVLDLLKSYISNQKTQWERYLPLVEFAYNNTIHSSTRKAPFEIVEGAMKVPPFLSTKDKIFEVDEYTRDLDTAFAKVRETLQKSHKRRKKAADRHRRDLKLKENDWVLLRFEKARLQKKKGKERLMMGSLMSNSKIFRSLRRCVGTFSDDMIIFSKSETVHMEHLRAVFEMLRKERLVVNGKKSEFFMEEIHFLGHIVSKDGVRMDLAKIKAIQDWPEPVNLREVRSFLGLCSYYRRFIRFFAEIAAPLHDLTSCTQKKSRTNQFHYREFYFSSHTAEYCQLAVSLKLKKTSVTIIQIEASVDKGVE
ncbi:hypothetical protein L7F22_044849 [Adiantum nelumboides]|nr:hypothetical protein [Adiantum nelumboides]